jgi:succinate-semialdehyde dehydrogenase/glutarate-semialdehyde dehydrogenase
MLAKMRNMGEACTVANRFIVPESLVTQFAARLATRMGALVVGRGTEPGVDVGPLVDAPSRTKVGDLVQDAVDRGAKVLVGGSATGARGHFFAPTMSEGVTPDARVLGEEIFGPVAPVTSFGGVKHPGFGREGGAEGIEGILRRSTSGSPSDPLVWILFVRIHPA